MVYGTVSQNDVGCPGNLTNSEYYQGDINSCILAKHKIKAYHGNVYCEYSRLYTIRNKTRIVK